MSDPVISVGAPNLTEVPVGDIWTPLVTVQPLDGRSAIHGQLATWLSHQKTNLPPADQRASKCEIQVVRLTPGQPENPTAQDDHSFTFDVIPAPPFIRFEKRQNWLYAAEMRTWADEPLRFEARNLRGPSAFTLEWIIKVVLLRPEASR